jgi:23S rRNA pseudouridine1911/1915/1917 synthase
MKPDGFDLLYEQGPCLVVAKPGGVLKQFLKVRDQKPGNVYLATLHRLDRPVSGALVFAKHIRAARRIATQFQNHTVQKTYWAVLEGRVEPETGTWTDSVRKLPGLPQAEVVPSQHPEGRLAVLHYRVLDLRTEVSWLEIVLETGRMHQIRLQAAVRGYPVLGDALYGARLPFGPQTSDPRNRWIALHARSLGFVHPMTREAVFQTAPLPDPWKAVQPLPELHR